jgi:hypothetical protein
VLGHQGSDEGLLPCVFIHDGSCPAVVCYLIVAAVGVADRPAHQPSRQRRALHEVEGSTLITTLPIFWPVST